MSNANETVLPTPEIMGSLLDLPKHVQNVIKSYGDARVRVAFHNQRATQGTIANDAVLGADDFRFALQNIANGIPNAAGYASKILALQPSAQPSDMPACKACDDEGVVYDEEGMKPCGACQDIDDAAPQVAQPSAESFQKRVQPWMMECFGAEISADRMERNHRFFEEATELIQANGMTRSEAHQLVDYTFNRPVGELMQESGGVLVTHAALCLASGIDMHECGEIELARIWTKVDKIRAKQAAKPKHSLLPEATPPTVDQDGVKP